MEKCIQLASDADVESSMALGNRSYHMNHIIYRPIVYVLAHFVGSLSEYTIYSPERFEFMNDIRSINKYYNRDKHSKLDGYRRRS